MSKKIITAVVFVLILAICGCANDGGRSDRKSNRTSTAADSGYDATEYTRYYQLKVDDVDDDIMDNVVRILTQRAGEYTTEAKVLKQGDDIVSIELPYIDDEVFKEITKRGEIQLITDYGTDKEQVILDNAMIKNAEVAIFTDNNNLNQYVVDLEFTDEGTEVFADVTTRLSKTAGKIYIVYDGELISSPTVVAPITGGNAQIAALNSQEEAEDIVRMIRSGLIPCKLIEVDEH